MNLRFPILSLVKPVIRVGDPVYLAGAYMVVNLKGFLDDQVTVVAPVCMHDNG